MILPWESDVNKFYTTFTWSFYDTSFKDYRFTKTESTTRHESIFKMRKKEHLEQIKPTDIRMRKAAIMDSAF